MRIPGCPRRHAAVLKPGDGRYQDGKSRQRPLRVIQKVYGTPGARVCIIRLTESAPVTASPDEALTSRP